MSELRCIAGHPQGSQNCLVLWETPPPPACMLEIGSRNLSKLLLSITLLSFSEGSNHSVTELAGWVQGAGVVGGCGHQARLVLRLGCSIFRDVFPLQTTSPFLRNLVISKTSSGLAALQCHKGRGLRRIQRQCRIP